MNDSNASPSLLGRLVRPALGLARALAAVVCVIAFFAVVDVAMHGKDATFWTERNLQTISVQNAFVAIAAVGMLVVIIAGGIDLSAGVMLALCATVIAWGMREDVGFVIGHGENVAGAARRLKAAADEMQSARRQDDATAVERWKAQIDERRTRLADLLSVKLEQLRQLQMEAKTSALEKAIASIKDPAGSTDLDPSLVGSLPNAETSAWLAVAMGVGAGAACGLVNGLIIVVLRVVPFIATLGTMLIYLGLAKIVAEETSIRPTAAQVPGWIDQLRAVQPDPAWLVVSKGVWLALIISAVIACGLRYTVFGRHVFALGSNEATARLCGINVPLTKIGVYVLAGVLVGVAAICFFAKTTTGNPISGTGFELRFIAAVVIGGGSLSGGRGTVLGALAGAVIMGVIDAGCTLLGMRDALQDMTLGAIIVAAVTVDQLRQKRD
jgi:ribose transport system permease protein